MAWPSTSSIHSARQCDPQMAVAHHGEEDARSQTAHRSALSLRGHTITRSVDRCPQIHRTASERTRYDHSWRDPHSEGLAIDFKASDLRRQNPVRQDAVLGQCARFLSPHGLSH
eukprot:1716785-Amphidinium_carterae.1